MPKRTDIHKILVIGSGPIVIGQAAEFDYAGTLGIHCQNSAQRAARRYFARNWRADRTQSRNAVGEERDPGRVPHGTFGH